jgi:hypothetical protein
MRRYPLTVASFMRYALLVITVMRYALGLCLCVCACVFVTDGLCCCVPFFFSCHILVVAVEHICKNADLFVINCIYKLFFDVLVE